MDYSLKQLFRMKTQTICLLGFMVIIGAFLALSSNLLIQNAVNVKEFEEKFTTIGTVEQKPSSVSQSLVWDARKQDYTIRQHPEYTSIYLPEQLMFENAGYIHKPEKRNYYGSFGPEYQLSNSNENYEESVLIVIFSPEEDCIPKESVKINIETVLSGQKLTQAWFCAHNEKNPEPLYKDKTYIAQLTYWYSQVHGSNVQEGDRSVEYVPVAATSVQFDGKGNRIEEEPLKSYYEVTEDFFKTDIGKRYQNLANSNKIWKDTFPVTATGATNLLMPFYDGTAYLVQGEDISAQEYEEGKKVCLISQQFARQNELEVGDFVKTRLYYTNAESAASVHFSMQMGGRNYNLLTAGGKIPEVFEEKEYQIKGIYDVTADGRSGEYSMGRDEMIVPVSSIEHPNESNILAYGPMKANTTSFQIENGKIEEFMEKWKEAGTEDLKITFYDKGYTQLKKGLDNMKVISLVLGIIAVIMGAVFLVFYVHLFLTAQKQRIALERCMGLDRKKCIGYAAVGILIVFLTGNIIGGIGGTALSHVISVDSFHQDYYDTMYSSGQAGDQCRTFIKDVRWQETACISTIFVGGYVLLGSIYVLKKIGKEVDKEPLYLLSEITKE